MPNVTTVTLGRLCDSPINLKKARISLSLTTKAGVFTFLRFGGLILSLSISVPESESCLALFGCVIVGPSSQNVFGFEADDMAHSGHTTADRHSDDFETVIEQAFEALHSSDRSGVAF